MKELIKTLRLGADISRERGINFDYALIADKAANAIEKLEIELNGLKAARYAYASEFQLDNEGQPDVGSIHQNIRKLKAECDGLYLDALRYQWLRSYANDEEILIDGQFLPRYERLDTIIDEAMKREAK